jgi:hypothetical protein
MQKGRALPKPAGISSRLVILFIEVFSLYHRLRNFTARVISSRNIDRDVAFQGRKYLCYITMGKTRAEDNGIYLLLFIETLRNFYGLVLIFDNNCQKSIQSLLLPNLCTLLLIPKLNSIFHFTLLLVKPLFISFFPLFPRLFYLASTHALSFVGKFSVKGIERITLLAACKM